MCPLSGNWKALEIVEQSSINSEAGNRRHFVLGIAEGYILAGSFWGTLNHERWRDA